MGLHVRQGELLMSKKVKKKDAKKAEEKEQNNMYFPLVKRTNSST